MKLHQMTPDQILHEIEVRSDALAKQELDAAEAKANLEAWEASTAIAYREAGMSMAEAKERVRGAPESSWNKLYTESQKAHIEAARLKRSYQLACTAADMWRSENATRRAVG